MSSESDMYLDLCICCPRALTSEEIEYLLKTLSIDAQIRFVRERYDVKAEPTESDLLTTQYVIT